MYLFYITENEIKNRCVTGKYQFTTLYTKLCYFIIIMSDPNSILRTISISVEIWAKELKPKGFQQMDHCPSSSKCATGVTNWFADLLSGNITHDIFVIYGNQPTENF